MSDSRGPIQSDVGARGPQASHVIGHRITREDDGRDGRTDNMKDKTDSNRSIEDMVTREDILEEKGLQHDSLNNNDVNKRKQSVENSVIEKKPANGVVVKADFDHRNGVARSVSADDSRASSGEKKEHLYKILVIGELGTGKTSIIKRYVHQFFSQHYRATIGVDFALKVLNWDADTIVRLQLWDIAGQERFGNMTRVYYKEAVGCFIVFDVTRASTFDAVVKWKSDLDSKVQLSDGSPVPCVLLANKCDQAKEGLVNNSNQMDEFCKDKGFVGWFETSAKENINIDDSARFLVNQILTNDKNIRADEEDRDRITLDSREAAKEKEKKGCC